ncbi:hypothetical protein [Erythrobacter sp.]|jgi:hypothetical protein|uniref:hypothetical protein n=1 Tax=Erythrobacter sp. TaxID=1042 RepID=UPI002E992166|nr:hypothetical protein [Erythrobacter sp.]
MRSAAHRLAHFLLLIAAFAACVQWTIPHGWMVASAHESAGEDFLLLVPCPATSPELAKLATRAFGSSSDHQAHHGAMDHSAKGHGSGDAEGKDAMHGAAQAQCDFAALGAPVLPPDPPDIAAPAPQGAALLPAFPEAMPGRGLAAPPPPARGPPSHTA